MGALRELKLENEMYSNLRVVRGTQGYKKSLSFLIDTAWNFAYSALWNTTIFSDKEVKAAKARINDLFTSSKNPDKAFIDFAQRVILARHYISSNKGRYIPLPSVWLDQDNEKGFAGTKQWLAEIKSIRSSMPNYKIVIKELAEAALEYSSEPGILNYNIWRTYLLNANAPGLFNLFQTFIINQQFNN
jgi:hypothetical protein